MSQLELKTSITELKEITKLSMDKWSTFIEKWRIAAVQSIPEEVSEVVLLFSELRSKILTITEKLSSEDFPPRLRKPKEMIGRMHELTSTKSILSIKPPVVEETPFSPKIKPEITTPTDNEIMKGVEEIPLFPKQEEAAPTTPPSSADEIMKGVEEIPLIPKQEEEAPTTPPSNADEIMKGVEEIPLFPKQEEEIPTTPLEVSSIKPLAFNVIVDIFEKVKTKKSKKVLYKAAVADLRQAAKDQAIPIETENIESMIDNCLLDLQERQLLVSKGQYLIKTEKWSSDKIF
ncbi:MAG: hypothetical protein ACFFDT_13885 [Candidatus Hodarchaeota archaeon]